ncbi:MAG: tRNA (adenosine(37)-N6)-dimethylallyltransferase MiaA [Desulfuromonadaceae bacterium]|nr:tRNA (adenosine(37)-N6)-dimethylallyltransferase MiaA [Desulfuromonadaceae bacterium]
MNMNLHETSELITVLGPTASGKTRLAVAIAEIVCGEIISADSRQVFRGMDIGSGKDLHEYKDIRYHLIDVLGAGEEFSVFEFKRRFNAAFEDITLRNMMPILCGGSGMYLDSVLRGYRLIEVPRDEALRSELAEKSGEELVSLLSTLKPGQHNSTDLLDRERTIRAIEIARGEISSSQLPDPVVKLSSTVIGIHLERDVLRQRITGRLKSRLDSGMIEEVEHLNSIGVGWDRLNYYGLEYRYVGEYLRGELNKNDMFQKLNAAIHNFAKRQMNWYRRMERDGILINWIDGDNELLEQAIKIIHK